MTRFRGLVWPLVLLALLAVLAALQYRWTGQISRAEQERLQAGLQSSLARFARDVEEEIGTLFRIFRVDQPEKLAARLARYRAEASYPKLVETVYFLDAAAGGLSKVNASGGFEPGEWPGDFGGLRDELRARRRTERPRRGGRPFPLPLLSGPPPAIAIPIAHPEPGRRWSGFSLSGFTLVALDADVLGDTILPALAERYFGDDYDVTLVDGRGNVVFATSDDGDVTERADAHVSLFSLGRPPGVGRRLPRPELAEAGRGPGEGGRRWEVFVRHRSGSVETVVAGARLRNLAVSFGILGILAGSIVLVAVSTRRATELNDRKMEFVAGVSHELRTPVAVLRSAGQNLADGSVSDPDQVKRYGALIESEGRRLDDLVEQVLALAGIQSRRRTRRCENVLVKTVLADALSDCESLRNERGVPIQTTVRSPEAAVTGDPEALRRALVNIITNAIKHGGDDNALEVTAEAWDGEVVVTVSDRGPGIPERDRENLFDAFYRGSRARERQVPGSGLGLSLVDHVVREHGGRVEVASTPEIGSRFTVRLPSAPSVDEG